MAAGEELPVKVGLVLLCALAFTLAVSVAAVPADRARTVTLPAVSSCGTASECANRLDRQNAKLRRAIRTIRRQRRATRRLVRSVPWGNHWLESAFLCIHSHEGRWSDPDGPYYGGLQFDQNFQRTYGREFLRAWGTADHWPAAVQITVAIRAYLAGRGFRPWPNTARYCGLL
jgi:hypothetical protein